eukprot:m.980092 g.980092  ORF g.980092 m.980092 type:complete len:59 (+) comp23963_c0_seq11:1259-1435(+)
MFSLDLKHVDSMPLQIASQYNQKYIGMSQGGRLSTVHLQSRVFKIGALLQQVAAGERW